MATETWTDQLARLGLMAGGDDKWDLSPNDCAAIAAAIEKAIAHERERAARVQAEVHASQRVSVLTVTARYWQDRATAAEQRAAKAEAERDAGWEAHKTDVSLLTRERDAARAEATALRGEVERLRKAIDMRDAWIEGNAQSAYYDMHREIGKELAALAGKGEADAE